MKSRNLIVVLIAVHWGSAITSMIWDGIEPGHRDYLASAYLVTFLLLMAALSYVCRPRKLDRGTPAIESVDIQNCCPQCNAPWDDYGMPLQRCSRRLCPTRLMGSSVHGSQSEFPEYPNWPAEK